MSILKWLFWLYLFIAPIIVAIAQSSVLFFSTANHITGAPYNPFPLIFLAPAMISIFILTIGALTTYTLNAVRRKNLSHWFEIIICFFLSSIFIIIFWSGLILSQRTVIINYLSTTGPKELHVLDIFFLPFTTVVFPKMGFSPYYTANALGITGVVGIIIYCYIQFSRKSQ